MPDLFIIAGCNGAGKTTASFTVLPEYVNVQEFVNADEIARGLSPFQPEKVALEAGKIMLRRMHELVRSQVNFAFETTLASRTFLNFIREAQSAGYKCTLVFYWLSTPEMAIERVKSRVRKGGHNIAEEVIRRRYQSGLNNFFRLYKEVVDGWFFFDNSYKPHALISEGNKEAVKVYNPELWNLIINTITS